MQNSSLRPDVRPSLSLSVISIERQSTDNEIDTAVFLHTAFKDNPVDGLSLLFKRYYSPLCSHAVRFVYSKQIAEDLVSDVYFKFFRTKAYENITSSYASYLFRSVRNECYRHLAAEFGKTEPIDDLDEDKISVCMVQPDAEMHYNNLFLKVNEAIEQLPLQCQRVFMLSRFENKKYNEIAKELHISPRTVEVHMSKALKYLRAVLRSEWTYCLCLTAEYFF